MFKSTLTAILLSSVSLVPAATIGVLTSVDIANAKSDNAGGNGNGNSGNSNKGGNSSNAKAKSSSGKTKSASTSSSKSRGGLRFGDDPVGNFLSKVTGQDKKTTTRAAKTKTTTSTKTAKVKDPMHPSNLGNMNGALNANINAVLAHVRNGNTNGPVGHLALLAVANVNADGAQDIVDLNENYESLSTLLGGQSLEDYLAERNGIQDPEVEAALTELDGLNEGDDGYDQALENLNNALGGQSLEDYESTRLGAGGDPDIDAAITLVGGDAETGVLPPEGPSAEEVSEATANLAAQGDAELAILSYWNKNDDPNPEITEQEQALLDKLNARLEGDETAIIEAMGNTDTDPSLDDDPATEDEELVVAIE